MHKIQHYTDDEHEMPADAEYQFASMDAQRKIEELQKIITAMRENTDDYETDISITNIDNQLLNIGHNISELAHAHHYKT
jgi:hypothetical protein